MKLITCHLVAALGMLVLPATALAGDVTFVLNNGSSYAVKGFFASPADLPNWQDDVFGGHALPSGNYVEVTVANVVQPCLYDMRFVLEDDSEMVEKDIDLCDLGEYTLSDAQ